MARSSANIGELNIAVNLELQRMQAQIDQANSRIRSMAARAKSDISKAASAINASFKTIGVGLSAAGVIAFGKSVLDLGGQITDLAAQANLSTDAFQAFSNTAMMSGVSGEQIANTFVKMQDSIQQATAGNEALNTSFGKLGLDANALKQIAPERQFEAIAKAVVNSSDKMAAMSAAMDILGAKNAPKLRQVLTELGEKGFDEVAKSMEGLRLTPDQLATLDAAGDKLDYIWQRIKLISAQGFLGVANAVEKGGGTSAQVNALSYGAYSAGAANFQRAQERALATGEAFKGANVPYNESASRIVREAAEAEAKAFDDAAAARAELSRRIQEGNAIYIAEQQQLAASAEAAERYKASQEDAALAEQEWARAMDEGARITERVRTPLEQYNAETSRLRELVNAGAISIETFNRALNASEEAYSKATASADSYGEELPKITEQADKAGQVISQMWENIADRTSDAIADMVMEGELNFKNLAQSIARMMLQIAIRMAVINPIMNGIFGLSMPSFFASGGRPTVGETAVVGENGPEFFRPDVAGTIIPNHRLSDIEGGGGGGTTIINADLRGATVESVNRLYAIVGEMNATFNQRAVSAVTESRFRGGVMARGLGA